jgi:hypothetical protein
MRGASNLAASTRGLGGGAAPPPAGGRFQFQVTGVPSVHYGAHTLPPLRAQWAVWEKAMGDSRPMAACQCSNPEEPPGATGTQ